VARYLTSWISRVHPVEKACISTKMEKYSFVNEVFHKFSLKVSKTVGSPRMFIGALLLIILWICTGPVFHFSDTWQLVINTSTTIITFLMVFVIQNSQNRESAALQLKLDELIRAVTAARNNLVNLEEFSDEELERLQEEFRNLRETESLKRTKNLKTTENHKKSERLNKTERVNKTENLKKRK
jgi:low affinity Fe/Cu permease